MNDLLRAADAAPPAELHIDLDALVANYRALRELARPARVSAVVKANAYGLGIGPVAAALAAAGCDTYFVSSLAEGIELRALQPQVRVLVLEGAGGAIEACRAARLVPVLNTVAEVREWALHAAGEAMVVQIDTGMNRAGLDAADVAEIAADGELVSRLQIDLVMTHLACADEPGHPLNRQQVERFRALRALAAHRADQHRQLGGDLARPGLSRRPGAPRARALRWPTDGERSEPHAPGRAPLGAGAAAADARRGRQRRLWGERTARAGTRVATVGAGYADGYPRALGNRGYAAVGGVRVPVVGRVSMDLTTLDVSAARGRGRLGRRQRRSARRRRAARGRRGARRDRQLRTADPAVDPTGPPLPGGAA